MALQPAFSPALFTDLYELTMLQAYFEARMNDRAVFSLFVRRLPPTRHYLLACGLDDVLGILESLRFDAPALRYLASLDRFSDRFLTWLEGLRFTGDVHAVPEGTPVFAAEPLLEIEAPLAEAQLVETVVMNQMHLQTLLASKASRVVTAAQGRTVVDFGLRRIHGVDAGIKAVRAFHVAGVDATSNVAGGQIYGVPVAGTLAHSFIQVHEDEAEAFRAFVSIEPETVLLVDTYDTLEGVRKVIALARELGSAFRVRAVRLDSGNLAGLARAARGLLDEAGLQRVGIFASGGLDERQIATLVAGGAPIDGFGVGAELGVSRDAPTLDIVYKMVSYGGQARTKLSAGKSHLPGPKQIYRVEEDGLARRDVLAGRDEPSPGRPLMARVMAGGVRTPAGRVSLVEARARATDELRRLPAEVRGLEAPPEAYDVSISPGLVAAFEELRHRYETP